MVQVSNMVTLSLFLIILVSSMIFMSVILEKDSFPEEMDTAVDMSRNVTETGGSEPNIVQISTTDRGFGIMNFIDKLWSVVSFSNPDVPFILNFFVVGIIGGTTALLIIAFARGSV